VSAAPDPEVNYFSAAHLAYAGQTDAALALLKRAVEDGYCAVRRSIGHDVCGRAWDGGIRRDPCGGDGVPEGVSAEREK